MFADPSFHEYVHPAHFMLFVEAAAKYRCHILVRKTGKASIRWMGKPGYTGKRGDLKAKTADAKDHPVAGLVCSPWLRPDAFSSSRLVDARKYWMESRHLITEPADRLGLDDRHAPSRCPTPYMVQTNPDHPHYGCLALVESGLFRPRYVHGDYDLFAIAPAGRAYDVEAAHAQARALRMGTHVAPQALGLAHRQQRQLANLEGPLAFQVSSFLNVRVCAHHPDMVGSLLVNHGEAVNLRKTTADPSALHRPDGARTRPDVLKPLAYEPVLAVMPRRNAHGQWAQILADQAAHEAFYQSA
ncbi:MAG TPA: hypothetical protein VFH59_11435 [Frateuria sp.]|uniref:hypothetical protein n=1 Tax=Frateuria sp. TaxID=2211372 RepID=UPI002D7F6A07|nr:hypothetical protein [Frateuria sp.]HET6806041.1 hypothetical protein [Frateuria sp.]